MLRPPPVSGGGRIDPALPQRRMRGGEGRLNVSILIVDDDRVVVDRLVEGVNWEAVGIKTVLTASNIRQAMELIRTARVDILLSDVEMPQGSGLELLEWVRQEKIPLSCIFLSSYAYFGYAQKAISLGGSDYLLKPVSHRELEEKLSALVQSLREKRGEAEEADEGCGSFWERLLLREEPDEAELSRAQTLGWFSPDADVCLWLVRVFAGEEEGRRRDLTLQHCAVQRAAEDCFAREGTGNLLALARRGAAEWFLVLEPGGEEAPVQTARRFRELLCAAFSSPVCLLSGKRCPQREIFARRDALERMERETAPDETGVIPEEDWVPGVPEPFSPPWREWEKELLDPERIPAVKEAAAAYLRSFCRGHQIPAAVLVAFRRELMQAIYRYLNRQDVQLSSLFDGEEYDGLYERAVRSLPDMEAFLRYLFEKLSGFRSQDNRQEQVVERIRQYVAGHLSEDLSRRTLAGVVFLSEDYVSRLFTGATGLSLSSYVAACRMQKAQELLRYSSLRKPDRA